MKGGLFMFISNLKIINLKNNQVLQNVDFHLGANFIVDMESSDRHNKVGKTTFLKLIDVALGAKDRKNIYVDAETNSTERKLESFIQENKSVVQLTLVDKFESPQKQYTLQAGLYKAGRYYINGDSYNQKEYQQKLNLLLFNNPDKVPSFRKLINSFVRISMSGDTNSFLRNLPHVSQAEVRGVYNYLFDISDPNIDKRRGDLEKQLRSLSIAEGQYKNMQGISSPEAIEQIITAIENEKKDISTKLNDIVNKDIFEENRKNLTDAREEYTELENQIGRLQYQFKRNQEQIDKTISESNNTVDDDLTNQFFDEVKKLIPSVNKSFEDLVTFNKKLFNNRVEYLQELNQDITDKISTLKDKQFELTGNNKTLVTLVANDQLSEYSKLTKQLSEREQELSKEKQILDSLDGFQSERDNLHEELEKLDLHSETNKVSYQDKTSKFNKYFTPFAERINGERPVLTYNPDVTQFPVAISELSGSSTGTRKSLIAAYDLAYQKFAEDEGKAIPNFVIHDVVENVEGPNLKKTVEIANEVGAQYIVAVLKEKLISSGFTTEEQKRLEILELSTEHRIFEAQPMKTETSGEFSNSNKENSSKGKD